MNPVEFVFDNPDLRKIILKYIVYEKYKEELKESIQNLLTDSLMKYWYRYCSCEICKANRVYHIATYGELL